MKGKERGWRWEFNLVIVICLSMTEATVARCKPGDSSLNVVGPVSWYSV